MRGLGCKMDDKNAQELPSVTESLTLVSRTCPQVDLFEDQDGHMRQIHLAAIGQVSGSIAHDLRSPLGGIRNANYLLRRRLKSQDPRILEPLNVIDQEVQRADQIISNLMAIARCHPPQRRKVDVALLIAEVMAKMWLPANTALHLDVHPDPCFIHCDPEQFKQVITNLMENAIQAASTGGQCWIRVHQTPELDLLEFEDNGPGVAENIRATLFEPLVTSKPKGTGLGLTICRQIVESHQGSITYECPEEGGTVFKISLPRITEESESFE